MFKSALNPGTYVWSSFTTSVAFFIGTFKEKREGEGGSQPGKKFWGTAEPGNPDDARAECHAGDIKRAERCSAITKINNNICSVLNPFIPIIDIL